MGNSFDAGSILVSLKANLDNFNAGIASAKQTLASFASGSRDVEVAFKELNTAVVVFKEIETSSNRIRGVFNSLESETQGVGQAVERTNTSWARATNRILSVQIALASLAAGPGGPNALKEAFQSLSNGVQTASAAFQLAQGNLSLLGAGLIGVGVAGISVFSRYLEDQIKATDTLTEAEIKSQKVIDAWKNSIADANAIGQVFKRTLGQELTQALGLSESAFASNMKRLREIPGEIDVIQQKISALSSDGTRGALLGALGVGGTLLGMGLNKLDQTAIQNLQNQIGVLRTQEERLSKEQETIASTAPWAKANAAVVLLNESLQKTRTSFADIAERGRISIALGVEEPLQAVTENLSAAKKVFDQLIEANQKIRETAFSGSVPTDRIDEFLKTNLHSGSDIGEAASKMKALLSAKQSIEAVNDLAKTFSTSIGDGMREAILNNEKPLAALAKVGENLFGNMIDQSVKRLETGLTDAFKSITGAGGEAIGLGITGILGAAGALLSRLGSKSSNSFNPVQSAVTSTQAFRGIVAGPSTVAIANVADNVSRAIGPLIDLQNAANGLLSKIESNTRGRGASPGGFPAVAAPTA